MSWSVMNWSMALSATEVMGPDVSPERTMSRNGRSRMQASKSSGSLGLCMHEMSLGMGMVWYGYGAYLALV